MLYASYKPVIAEHTKDAAVFLFDENLRCVHATGDLLDEFGYESECACGKVFSELFSPHDADVFMDYFEQGIAGKNVQYATRVNDHDVHVTYNPIVTRKDGLLQLLIMRPVSKTTPRHTISSFKRPPAFSRGVDMDTTTMTYTLYTRNELEELRIKVELLLEREGYDEDDINDVSLALHELGINGIEHGNKADPRKAIHIAFSLRNGTVSVSIEDEGPGFKPTAVPDPTDYCHLMTLLATNDEDLYGHGRGIWLSKEYVDSLEYNDKGNKVTFSKTMRTLSAHKPTPRQGALIEV